MPKESFEQFIKRQKEKLDKAEKMVEEVKEEWKEEIERFVEKSVKELKKLWEENEEEAAEKEWHKEAFSFFLSLPLPEIPPFFLERICNKFLQEFDRKKLQRIGIRSNVGLFLSAFLKKNIENYISSQKKKGIKEEKIKPIEVHLDVKELPVRLSFLGYQNPQKLHLRVEGNLGHNTGAEMEGGEIIVEGNCEALTGETMKGGKIVVKGNCSSHAGSGMEGGVLILEGEVGAFDKFTFSPDNKGTIIWKGIKIWENGNWTEEGKEMYEKKKIPGVE